MKPLMRTWLGLSFVAVGATAFSQNGIMRVSDPSLSPNGQRIAFTWQGDLFLVPAGGGAATRLTVHPADESNPVWTPDGSRIVFASNRLGSLDLYSVAPDGSGLRRLTYESSDEYPTSISPDGRHILGYTNAFGRLNCFAAPAQGGDLVALTNHPLELAYWPTMLKDNRTVVYVGGGSVGHWRKPGQDGANTGEIWLADWTAPLQRHRKITKNEWHDSFPCVAGDRIFFVSNRSGAPNVWSMGADGQNARQHTRFTSGTVRGLTVSADGKKFTFIKDSGLYMGDTAANSASPLTVHAPEDSRRDPYVTQRATTWQDMKVSPNGRFAILETRGELFLTPERGGVSQRLTSDVRPDTGPMWLDDDRALFVATGDQSKRYLAVVNRNGEVSSWLEDDRDLSGAQLSPDRKWVAFVRGDNELCVRSVDGGEVRVVTTGGLSSALLGGDVFSWSPDSKWLAVAVDRSRGVEVRIHPMEDGEPIVVYVAGKSASTPVFSNDGQYVAFSAIEGNNYSEIRNSIAPLYAVRLTPEPLTFDEDALLTEPPQTPPASNTVRVEERGLRQRVRVLTSASVTGIWPHANGNAVWANVDGQFSTVSLASGSVTPVAGVTGFAAVVDRTANAAYLIASGRLMRLDLRNGSVSPINVSAEWRVDQAEEEQALFEEIWWAMSRFYYDPEMHRSNWAGVRAEFEPLVKHATSRSDFYALMSEMMERLNSSHLGATAPASAFTATERSNTGWLGVDWDPAAQLNRNEFVVKKVYEGTPAAHPDSALLPGDVVVAVNGVRLGGDQSMAELLDGSIGKRTVLSVRRGTRTVEVAIKPISRASRSGVMYDDWVQWNKAYVDRASNGRFGYIHIQGMDEPSLSTFLREIQTDLEGKDGVVVDVRFNGGGYTSHIILNIMRKEPWLIRTNRDMPELEFSENNYRGNALELPAVGVTNQYSFSNAEIFSEGFQRLGLGEVVGERTAGGVIGTGAYGLWDGGQIRMPGSGAYTVDMENLERNGRRPTVEVLYDPNAWNRGKDPQLDAAVDVLRRNR